MRILVTGGVGFIGSHVVDRYIELGHEVAVVDNLYTGKREYVHPKARFYEVDIQEREKVNQIFSEFRPEILNHHAAQMDVRKSVADPVFDAKINILGLLNLMEAGRATRLKKVIFASSGGTIYGDADKIPTPESYPPSPASPYGVAKLTSEYYLDYYCLNYNILYNSLRYANVYGPRQNPHGEAGVVAIFTQKILKGEQPLINGDGEQARDFVYVSDVVAANVSALDTEGSLTVNIGTGKGTSVNQIFRSLKQLTQSEATEKHIEAKKGEQRISILDWSLAKKILNWSPKVDLETGLKSTVDYFTHAET